MTRLFLTTVVLMGFGFSVSSAEAQAPNTSAKKTAAKKAVTKKPTVDPSASDPEAGAPVRNAAPSTYEEPAAVATPTPPPPPAQVTPPPPVEPKHEVKHAPPPPPPAVSSEHLFGFHAALGIPHPISYGLNYVLPSKLVSAEVSTGSYSATIDNVRAKIQNTEAALRWHPFAGTFFLGGKYGTQKINGDKTDPTYGFTGSAEVKSNYFTPNLGWIWGQGGMGLFASFELGYQFPSNVTTDFSSDASAAQQATPEYQDLQTKVKDNAEKLGKMGLPYVGLFKLGFLF